MAESLAYIHPAWQGIGIVLALVTLTLGLRHRSIRRGHANESRVPVRRRHMLFGVSAVWVLLLGWVLGVVSMPYLRNQPLFGTWHAWVATAAVLLFVLGGYYGRKMYRGGLKPEEVAEAREIHVFCVGLAMFLALIEIVMGFPLLP